MTNISKFHNFRKHERSACRVRSDIGYGRRKRLDIVRCGCNSNFARLSAGLRGPGNFRSSNPLQISFTSEILDWGRWETLLRGISAHPRQAAASGRWLGISHTDWLQPAMRFGGHVIPRRRCLQDTSGFCDPTDLSGERSCQRGSPLAVWSSGDGN